MPIPENTCQFLYHLWAGSNLPTDSIFTFTAIHPERGHPTPSRHLVRGDSTSLVEALEALLAANAKGWGAFVAVATRQPGLTRWQRGGKADLVALPALYVDIDRPPMEAIRDLRRVKIPPSCLVGSGRGLHAYWWLRPATRDLESAQAILSRLAWIVRGDSLSVAQSLRLPGSMNTKHGRPCRIMGLHPERRYTLEDFSAYLPRKRPADRPSIKQHRRSSAKSTNPLYAATSSPPHSLNPELIHQIERALIQDYAGCRRENGWIASLCPAGHEHDRPGQHFHFNPVLGMGHCFGRHGRLLLKDLCPLLGIEMGSDFYLVR
ncbi:MAG: hypothetical protein JXN59_09695 [Anaerolineae bacterium]|nr:hypothetical protein [Anaerolineae bacterium]